MEPCAKFARVLDGEAAGVALAWTKVSGMVLVVAIAWMALGVQPALAVWARLAEKGALSICALSFIAAVVLAVRHLAARPDPWLALSKKQSAFLVVLAAVVALHGQLLALQTLSWLAIVSGATIIAIGSATRDAEWLRRTLLIAALLVISLPTVAHLETYFGFAVRKATAELVAGALAAMGVAATNGETVIVFENGIADVAEACSGMKTLWTGALGLTWVLAVQRRVIWTKRTVIVAVSALTLLLAGNAARVFCLVWLDHVAQAPLLARVAHTPLGLFNFVAVMATAFLFLRQKQTPAQRRNSREPISQRRALALITCLALAFVARPLLAPKPAIAMALPGSPDLPGARRELLDAQERTLFESHHARAFKWSLTSAGRKASVIIVVADSFRAHHAPEVCAAAHGHRVEQLRQQTVGTLPATTYALDGDSHRGVYWFESENEITDSLFSRTVSPHRGDRWALVSIAIAGDALPSDALLQTVHTLAHQLVAPGEPHGTEDQN